jgi:DNA-directed RNA polymerase subunit RPC12/RpoP
LAAGRSGHDPKPGSRAHLGSANGWLVRLFVLRERNTSDLRCIAGPDGVYICEECARKAVAVFDVNRRDTAPTVRCPVCGTRQTTTTGTGTHRLLAWFTFGLWVLMLEQLADRGARTRRCMTCGHIWRA